MENKELKKLDDLSKKIMGDVSLETPSFGFEQKLMRQIEPQKRKGRSFSFFIWFASGSIAGILVLFLLSPKIDLNTTGWLNFLNLSFSVENAIPFSNNSMDESNVIIYAIIALVLMVTLQTIILRRFFMNRFRS
ncbi:MAG: hypothetical protein MI810_11985 [Flavobacteriales bacterium]|nr:hypothetical protein [Flavobacteriales bacterium]